tara:strand:- start:296 stop:451 length:156 start_codon:yes stop_codon:yes gene_type:complete
MKTPEELAKEHWEWVSKLMTYIPVGSRTDKLIEYLYKTAMIHGYKHGKYHE